MEIIVNHHKTQIEEQTTLQQLIDLKVGDAQKGLAVAVNQNVVPKNRWNDKLLQENDEILIIKATQGG